MKLSLVIVLSLSSILLALGRVAPRDAYPPAGIGKWDNAVTQANIASTICTPGYTDVVRNGDGGEFGAVTAAIKKRVYVRDGKTHLPNHCCEVDHFFPLELGGANIIDNLWAESWDPPYGARQKDRVETRLHRMVCATNGPMPLKEAQKCLASDWVACGKRIGALR